MEALPNMLMLAPNFRTSTLSYDNIPHFEWRLAMKEFILVHFQADPHEFDGAMDELVQMKYDANVPSATVEQMCKLKRYYGQLCMMQKRFPMVPGGALETPFTWHDGLVDMRSANSEVTLTDIEFEKASVMFNIGAAHAQYAAEQPRDSQDSIKLAFMHFQYAAYAFEQLNTFRNSEIFYPSVDLDANVILFFYKVLIAQAQECLVQKSLLDNRSPIVIARLALWIQETLDSASKIADEWTVNIPESLQRYYERVCRLKSDMYGVIAHMSLGDHSEKEEKKMGFRLQFYNIAAKFMSNVSQDRKLKERYPELYVSANFLNDVVTAKQKNAEKENNFIYHDRMPTIEEAVSTTLNENGPMCKVRTIAFDPLDSSVCGDDLFASLLPSTVVDANKKYESQKSDIYRATTDHAKVYDELLANALEKAGFDNLRFMLNEGKNAEMMYEIPEELMKRNADMTSYPDCIPNLLEKLRESSETARVAEAKLNTLIAKLRAIDLPRLRSDEGYQLISKELDKLAEHLALAKSNNVSLNKAIASHSANLQILSLPCHEMWSKIVPEPKKADKGMISQEEATIRKMVDKILEMKAQRIKLIEQFAADLKADDLSKKLMGTNEQGAEEVRTAEIAKHTKTQHLIRLNVEAQNNILRAFADANADFCEQRMSMQSDREEYERRVREISGSYDVYRDVAQKCEEGEVFYRQLMARCDQFAVPIHAMEEQYRAEMEKKELAQKEAEQRMQQLRMSREAQNAMMDFGGPPAGFPPQGSMGPPPGAPGAYRPSLARPPGGGARAPRLGDYLESYRARKTQNPQMIQIPPSQDPMPDELGGPPSPTPSSVCDFPVNQRGSRTVLASPRYSGAPGSQGSPGQQQYQGPPAPISGYPTYAPPPTSHYQPPPPQQFGAHGSPGPLPSAYPYHQPPPRQAPPTSSPNPPTLPTPPAPQPYQHHPEPQMPQGPSPGYPNQAYGPPPTAQVFQHPPQGAPITAPPQPQHHQHLPQQNYSAFQTPGAHSLPNPQGPGYQGYGAPAVAPPSQPPAPQPPVPQNLPQPQVNIPQAQGGYGAPGAYGSGFQSSGTHGPPSSAPIPHQPSSQGVGVPPVAPETGYGNQGQLGTAGYPAPGNHGAPSSVFGAHPTQLPHSQGVGAYSGTPGVPGLQGPPGFGTTGPPRASNLPPSHFPAPQQNLSSQASQASSARQTPIPQSTAQTPVAPVAPQPSGPVQNQQNPQNFAAPPSGVSGVPQQPQQPQQVQQQQMRFQPTPGAPSPWHATPQELKTPWNTAPQYHAPTQTPQNAPTSQPTQQTSPQAPPPTQLPRNNVDLLSDLLGDFNLPPPLQPAIQNTQNGHQAPPQPTNYQQPIQQQQDFRSAPGQLDPGKPVGAVPPMPQQPQNTFGAQGSVQGGYGGQQITVETPILVKGASPSSSITGPPMNMSVTDVVDPTKFELGLGNAQKLEKRMLHHSIRTNVAPPPLNQLDPLNQIDAFSFAMQNSRQK